MKNNTTYEEGLALWTCGLNIENAPKSSPDQLTLYLVLWFFSVFEEFKKNVAILLHIIFTQYVDIFGRINKFDNTI